MVALSGRYPPDRAAQRGYVLVYFRYHPTHCDPDTDMIFAEVDSGDGRDLEVIDSSREPALPLNHLIEGVGAPLKTKDLFYAN
jgi:hypothetical protein